MYIDDKCINMIIDFNKYFHLPMFAFTHIIKPITTFKKLFNLPVECPYKFV